MGFPAFLDLMLALEHKDSPQAQAYLFRCLDLQDRGYISAADIDTLFRYCTGKGYCTVLYCTHVCGAVLGCSDSTVLCYITHSNDT